MPLFCSQSGKGNVLGFARHDWLIFVSAHAVIYQSKWMYRDIHGNRSSNIFFAESEMFTGHVFR